MTMNDNELFDSIRTVIETTGISHFPTHRELDEFYGNKSVSCQLSKRGGIRRWSKLFELPPAKCANTKFGDTYELKAIEDIEEETGLKSILAPVRYPYDIYTNSTVKIDVKASMPLKGRNFDCWSFNLEKKIPTCDIYIFYCVRSDLKTSKRLIIPSSVLSGTKQVGIGSLSKYDNYIERWDYIAEYNDFMTDMKDQTELIPKRRTMA